MLNQALNINKLQSQKKEEEFTEEDYDQINKDISKALNDMKKNNEEEEDEDNEENEIDKLNFFDKDFFTDSSNSISFDNLSDISEKSFKSANVEMKNNTIKNMMKNNLNLGTFYNKENNKDIFEFKNINSGNPNENIKTHNSDNKINLNINLGNLGNQEINNRNNIFIPNNNNNNNINNIQINPNFNKNIFPLNSFNNQFQRYNNINPINPNNNIQNYNNIIPMNNSINPNLNFNNFNMNNSPMFQNTNFPINNIQNPNLSMLNNNMNNNLNIINQNQNHLINNPSLNNINIINYNNNNLKNENIFNKEKRNNSALLSYPIISERGVPGLYNLDSPKNIINIENIMRNRDKRTTLIIRNIPNKYTISLLLKELNTNFENKFDIVYLPQDFINKSNLGFGFINFVNHMHLILFYQEFVNKKWNFFNSKKRCNLAYSKYQGKNELIKYILTKLGISNLDNNSENIKKSFFINNNKNIRAPIEIPINFYAYFVSYHPFSLCRKKDDKVFIVDKYYNI